VYYHGESYTTNNDYIMIRCHGTVVKCIAAISCRLEYHDTIVEYCGKMHGTILFTSQYHFNVLVGLATPSSVGRCCDSHVTLCCVVSGSTAAAVEISLNDAGQLGWISSRGWSSVAIGGCCCTGLSLSVYLVENTGILFRHKQ
jgi:hypothetical protein